MYIFVMYHLEMGLKQNEGKGNSVTTGWKYNDFSKVHRKMHLTKWIAIYDALNKRPAGWLLIQSQLYITSNSSMTTYLIY